MFRSRPAEGVLALWNFHNHPGRERLVSCIVWGVSHSSYSTSLLRPKWHHKHVHLIIHSWRNLPHPSSHKWIWTWLLSEGNLESILGEISVISPDIPPPSPLKTLNIFGPVSLFTQVKWTVIKYLCDLVLCFCWLHRCQVIGAMLHKQHKSKSHFRDIYPAAAAVTSAGIVVAGPGLTFPLEANRQSWL